MKQSLDLLKEELYELENNNIPLHSYIPTRISNLKSAIQEIKDLQNTIDTVIEEIEYALSKPQYADVYLNNAIRFLKEIKECK